MSKIIHNQIQDVGFQVINSAIDKSLIETFNEKYKWVFENTRETWLSYLPSRTAYVDDETVKNLVCLEIIDDYAEEIGVHFSIHMVEARVGSSNIQWHRDYNEGLNLNDDPYDGQVPNGNHYYGAIIALNDFGDNCGAFEIVPNSHKWKVDTNVINYKNMIENPKVCYKYYEDAINMAKQKENLSTYEFKGKQGDFIIWHGLAVHRGKQSELPQEMWIEDLTSFRNSLFFHFTIVNESEFKKQDQNTYIKVENRKNIYLNRPI